MKRLPRVGTRVVVTGHYVPGGGSWSTPVREELFEPVVGECRGWSESVERAVAVMLADRRVLHCRADQIAPAE